MNFKRKISTLQQEAHTNEGINLIQEILNDLLRRQLNCKILSINKMQNNETTQYSPNTKKQGISHRYYDVTSLQQLDDDIEINRLIKNLRSSISSLSRVRENEKETRASKSKEQKEEILKTKLEVLLDLRARRIRAKK